MAQRLVVPVVLAVALFGAIVYIVRLQSELTTLRDSVAQRQPAAAPARKPPSPTASAAPRTLTAEQREAMLTTLREETGPVRKAWLQVESTKAEPAAYTKALEQVFRDAGWEVSVTDSGGLTFKPGVALLVADDEWPPYASTAYDALQKAGIDVKAARGYRAYYEEQTRDKPGWRGAKMAADQTYVVIVGPNPG
jgi:uncharacterized membrane protein